jgi:predicted DNA-binding transcriptional regulator YafY
LTHCVFQKFTVRIRYHSAHRAKDVEREVDPYKLWYVNNGLYLVGHDHRDKDLRTFAMERIQSAQKTNRRFEIPEDFNFEDFKRTAFSMVWGDPQEVKIKFSSWQAGFIRERTWHPSQQIETCDDGGVILTLHVADLGEVKRWLIGFGAEAVVIHPGELQKDIIEETKGLIEIYHRQRRQACVGRL